MVGGHFSRATGGPARELCTMHALPRIALLCVFAASAAWMAAAEFTIDRVMIEEEETHEIRLENLLRSKGHRAVFDRLTKEMAEKPKPYVKAWYANYLIYGEAFGLKEVADEKRGYALARESSAEGSLFGHELVGRAYGDGRGPGFRDSLEAVKYLTRAAELGRDSAMCELSKYYFFGKGVEADRKKAEQLARSAACQGAEAGMMNLAGWWEDAKYAGTADAEKAMALYFEAADLGAPAARGILRQRAEKGDPSAIKYMHLDYVVGAREGATAYPARLKQSVRWLEQNTSPDDLRVQLAIAELMIEKLGPVYDAKKARDILTRAANSGSDDAKAMLATMAWRGIGQKADPLGAIASWKELADRNNARALNQLGWLHWWGNGAKHGIAKDAKAAFELCRRSADLGYWVGQQNTAACYAHGVGTQVNYYLAAKYYDILEGRGYINAREMKQRTLAHIKD